MSSQSRAAAIVLSCALAAPASTVHARIAPAANLLMVTSTADTVPPCPHTAVSLRCAIAQANADGSGDTIDFHIPAIDPGCAPSIIRGAAVTVCTIVPTRPLPTLTASTTTINGYSQTGAVSNTAPFPAGDNAVVTVRLDGARAGAGADGFTIAGARDTITGLSITDFITRYDPSLGQIGGNGATLTGISDTVSGNFIGVMPDGISAAPNQFAGVSINPTSGGEIIGGVAPASSNVLSGNGVCSLGDCSGFAVYVWSGSGTVLARNYIGTTASGQVMLPNRATGVVILSNDTTVSGNVISGNGGDGLLLGASRTLIARNLIGTDATGLAGLGNHSHGLDVQGPNNTILANVISANGDTGLVLLTGKNVVQGNRVGTNVAGAAALGNGFSPSAIFLGQPINGTDGIVVCSGPNIIGGTARSAGNLISGNAGNGVSLVSDGNTAQGNIIGTNTQGTVALANGVDGIGLSSDALKGTGFCQQAPQIGGNNNLIGGTTAGAGNLISGNKGDGIEIVQGSGNVVAGNRVGTSAAVTGTLPNRGDGVFLGGFCDNGVCHGSSNNMIGGTTTGAGNIIGGNSGDGVHLDGLGNGESNDVQGNLIGFVTSGGAILGNGGNGVFVGDSGVNDQIGGTAAHAGNVIAHNSQSGVLIGSSSADTGTHSSVQRNAIFANGALGIDLAPQNTVNCSTSPPGPNDYTPCPVITGASTTQVNGTACASCTVEVYLALSEVTDQGHGQGAALLASTVSLADGTWSVSLKAGQVATGQQVTASATTPVGFQSAAETSEFAANVTVVP